MRLYVKDKKSNQKIHLRITARSRRELASTIGKPTFVVNGSKYHVRDVKAEQGADSATVAALVGGVVGALGGPGGVILGSAIGALIGGSQVEDEKKAIELFNRSST